MAYDSESGRVAAKKLKRDAKGHFIKSTISVSGSGDVKINPEFEKPIVSVAISNPFKKILYWLDQIRRHQTTTFAFKLSIPLIVIPVIIAAAFSLGRINGINFYDKLNTEQAISASLVVPSPLPVSSSRAGTLKVAKGTNVTNYLLSLANGTLIVLDLPANIDLTKYANKQVLVTGTYDKNVNIMKVADIAEVTVFNSLVVAPEASGSAN